MVWDTNNIIIASGIAIIFIIVLYFMFRGGDSEVTYQPMDTDTLEKMEEKTNEIYNQRIKMIAGSVDVIWNSLAIDHWSKYDKVEDLQSALSVDSLVFSEDIICVYATYIPRSLKVTCQLAWSKQKMYVRVEQQLDAGVIEVEDEFILKAGIISVLQADEIAEKYFDSLTELMNLDKNAAKTDAKEQEKEEKSED